MDGVTTPWIYFLRLTQKAISGFTIPVSNTACP